MSAQQIPLGPASVRHCVPGWPFEWVSGRGRYEGRTESLVLVHFAACSPAGDGRRMLLLTAKDRRRRSWSTVLTFDDGPLLHEFERALAGKLRARLRELGDVTLRTEAGRTTAASGSVVELRPARTQSRKTG